MIYHMDKTWYAQKTAHHTPDGHWMPYHMDSTARYHHCIELHMERAWYHTVSARYTTPSVHGIPHCKSMVFHTASPWYFTNLWRIAQTIDRHETATASALGGKVQGGGGFQTTVWKGERWQKGGEGRYANKIDQTDDPSSFLVLSVGHTGACLYSWE